MINEVNERASEFGSTVDRGSEKPLGIDVGVGVDVGSPEGDKSVTSVVVDIPRITGLSQDGKGEVWLHVVDSGGKVNALPFSAEVAKDLETLVESHIRIPDLDAENELADLEVIHEMFIKPFYEEYDKAIARVLRGRRPGEIFQAENGLVMCIREQVGHFTYNKPYDVARSMVHSDDRNTLAAKTMKEAGFVPRIPVDEEDQLAMESLLPSEPPNQAGKIAGAQLAQELMKKRGMTKEQYDELSAGKS